MLGEAPLDFLGCLPDGAGPSAHGEEGSCIDGEPLRDGLAPLVFFLGRERDGLPERMVARVEPR